MDEHATGLALRLYSLTETSLVVHWLTEKQGRIATVAKGARRPKSPFRGKLDLFHLAEFSFRLSRRSDLHTLAEVALVKTFPALRQNWKALEMASRGVKRIERATETGTPLPGIFQLLTGFLCCMEKVPLEMAGLAFDIKLLDELGLQPHWEETRLQPGIRKTGQVMQKESWETLSRLKPSPGQARELRRFVDGFFQRHAD